jgi:hypothetical protein
MNLNVLLFVLLIVVLTILNIENLKTSYWLRKISCTYNSVLKLKKQFSLLLFLYLFFLGNSIVTFAQPEDSFLFNQSKFSVKNVNVYFVPVDVKVDKGFQKNIESTFLKSKIYLNTYVLPVYRRDREIETDLWLNPPADSMRFSREMKIFRNDYFKNFPSKDPNAIYFFIINGFNNQEIDAYSVPTKGMIFIKNKADSTFLKTIAYHMGSSFGLQQSTDSTNLMFPKSGFELTWEQCLQLRKNPITLSLFDDYEFVRTNNGLNAYYFWKEDKEGYFEVDSLNPANRIIRPFKRNYQLFYVKIDNVFFNPLFNYFGKRFCLMHILAVVFALILVFIIRRKVNNRLAENKGFFKRQSLRSLKWLAWISSVALVYFAFWLVDWFYQNSVLKSHRLKDFKGLTIAELFVKLNDRDLFAKQYNKTVSSYIFQRRDQDWYVFKRDKVLYFDVEKIDGAFKAKLVSSSNRLELTTKDLVHSAKSHYIVFRDKDSTGEIVNERVYNHLGVDLSNRFKMSDPAKRILVFVNGYRPVSISNSLEQNLTDIQNKGTEYPNSKNYLYSYDRYNYWRPWNAIDLLFQNRINPGEVWYADGHHSVSTSNHGSLVNFTTNSGIYPKPCKSKKKHKCYQTTIAGNKKVKTLDLLATNPNNEGFKLRKERGRIAGKNLNQILNELPNQSKNDTLYIVSHSMGYAYSLGIIEELRGKIQFGACYILAPENASSGKIIQKEWREVWQYGAKLTGPGKNKPCQQDGVAPQLAVKGLSKENRVYFPKNQIQKMGYFQSHFVGYYTWVLDIPKWEKGYVEGH